jgi:CRISPR-associated endonuclease Csn1
MNSYTLGLDIGSNSIGWALLKTDKKPAIIDIGVRVFPEGVDRDTKGLEKSKNATRREARGARRIKYRRNLRKNQLVNTLKTAGFLPENKEQLSELFKKNPYQLRAMGLDEKLGLYEFGRALFHINQRRGFKSNRKTDKVKKEGKVAKEAGELQEKIDKAGCRTLGEYFANINPEEKRIREQYTFRSMYEYEFDKLWTKQRGFYPEVLTEDLRKKIRDEIIFFQRPLKPVDHLIGDCELEPDKKRCPRGDWYARRFRLLQDVNNLKIIQPDGLEQKLTSEQREVLLKDLSNKKELSWDKVRKLLGLIETQEFNLEQGKMKKLKGDVLAVAMKSKNIFGPKQWDSIDETEKIKLNDWLVELDDDELIEKLASGYNLDEAQRDRVLKISLPQRYMSFSRKAIIKLLEFMEQGALTHEAIAAVYPDRGKTRVGDEALDKLPLPEDLRNPIVNKALFEIRKVANAIIREYGKPTKIALEMARDVRGNAKERRELHFKMLENENRNKETRKRLTEDLKIRNPSRDDIIKYNLWEECGHSCPYTGKHISQAALFGENPEFQVEHILPYNRSLDDSYMNKTLCDVYENTHVKGDKTPYEAYSHDEEKYEQIKQRVNSTKMPPWKKRKFWQKELNIEQCIRNLNDTRYICKEVVKYLKQIGINVRGTKGRITAELRHQWGLNSILDLTGEDMKNRDDHRHHTIDAAVVAVTDNKHLHKLAQSKYSTTEHNITQPWPNFREELAEKVKGFRGIARRNCIRANGKDG